MITVLASRLSWLCRGSELLREVAWVVFDEVHYMQDRERGVVWEETIIFLPKAVNMVFLSATLSNASEFAAWVANVSGLVSLLQFMWHCGSPQKQILDGDASHHSIPSGQGLHGALLAASVRMALLWTLKIPVMHIRQTGCSQVLRHGAAWTHQHAAQVHGQPCHVVYTEFRPTPLQHYAFPLGGNGLRLVSCCCAVGEPLLRWPLKLMVLH